MRTAPHAIACLAIALVAQGCIPGEETNTDQDGAADMQQSLLDATSDAGPANEAGIRGADDGVDSDGGGDSDGANVERDAFVEPPDAFLGTEIDTCEQACARYAECGRAQEVFGDEAACLGYCQRISEEGRPGEWFDCLEVEACNLMHRCPRPPVDALECGEVCELAAQCEVPLPFEDCPARCADGGDAFQACGEHLLGDCGNADFVGCLGTNVYPACETTCERAVACNVLAEEGCVLDCIGGLFAADPLARLRANQRNACVGRQMANACEEIDRCVFPIPADQPRPPPDLATFCREFNQCGFDFFGCEEAFQILQDEGGPTALQCTMDILRGGCPEDEFTLLDQCLGGGVDPTVPACQALCEAQDVCGLLPEGEERPACVQACINGFSEGNDLAERLQASLACGAAGTCDELVACLEEAAPRADCETLCEALDGCDLAEEGCVDACDAVWPRDRHAAYRACVAEAADNCEAVAACEVARTVPCGPLCARLAECGEVDDAAACAGFCDDEHFAEPNEVAAVAACVLAAPQCDDPNDPSAHTVLDCQSNSTEGQTCFGFCRTLTDECSPGAELDLATCVSDCGVGLAGDLGLRFAATKPCLAELEIDADCDALGACVPGEVELDCAEYCEAAAACDVPRADCAARCAEDPLARLRVLEASRCLPDAGDDCEAVRGCIDPPQEPIRPNEEPPFDQAAFCAAWEECFGFFFACQEALQQLNSPGARACALQELQQGCPFDPEDVFFFCEDEGGVPQVHPIADACERLCRARAFCDEELGQAECRRACRDDLELGDPDSGPRLAPRLNCAGAWSCPDLDPCLEGSTPEAVCQRHCAALDACEIAPEACADGCDGGFARLRQFAWRDCVRRAADDCEAITACAPPAQLPCDRYCDRLDDCGQGNARCEPECDDRHFEEPLPTALEVSCVLSAAECADPDVLSVDACLDDPEAGGRACLGFCRATTECDPEIGEADLVACVNRCTSGFGDRDALHFAAAADCLEGIAIDAQCAPLRACLPEGVELDCAAHCQQLEDCSVPAEDCAEACAEAQDADLLGCVVDAVRVGAGCEGVAECAGYEPPEADPLCRELCDRHNDCDREVDPFLCRLGCTPLPEALPVQLGCARVTECDDFDECLELDAELNDDCAEPCEAAGVCRIYADEAQCNAACTGQAASPRAREDYVESLSACLEEVIDGDECDRDQALECFNPSLCELTNDIIRVPPAGGRVQVNTALRQNLYEGSCGGDEGPEQVVVITIRARAAVTFEMVNIQYDTLIWLRSACDDPAAEIDCNDDGGEDDFLASRIDARLDPGTYFLFVDGFSDDRGEAELVVTVNPL